MKPPPYLRGAYMHIIAGFWPATKDHGTTWQWSTVHEEMNECGVYLRAASFQGWHFIGWIQYWFFLSACRDKKGRGKDKQEKHKGNQNGHSSPTHNPMKATDKEGEFAFSTPVSVGTAVFLWWHLWWHCVWPMFSYGWSAVLGISHFTFVHDLHGTVLPCGSEGHSEVCVCVWGGGGGGGWTWMCKQS